MIIRTYSCLNRHCRHEFDSDHDFPPCPRCRGLRVLWVPKPVAIRSSVTSAIDKTARELAADFGMSNFRSPVAGQAAMPPPPAATNKRNTFEPQKGWRIDLPDEALSGAGHAVCAPANVTAKIKVDPNAGALPPSTLAPPALRSPDALRQNTRIEGTHRGRIER
jgi:hypothetical protein